MNDSNPGFINSSLGGVGFNVALASHLVSKKNNVSNHVRLVSAVGSDFSGSSVLSTMKNDKKMDISGIYTDPDNTTAQYVSIHDKDGELIVACAAMDIATKIPLEHLEKQILASGAKTVVADANVSAETLQKLIEFQKLEGFKLIFEPTSSVKATKIVKTDLNVYPNNEVYMITPTFNELNAIHEKFSDSEKFDLDKWFPILDALQIDKKIRSLSTQITSQPIYKRLWDAGVFQKSFQLLPYFPNIIVKDGKNGVCVFSIQPLSSKFKSEADLFFHTNGLPLNNTEKLCATFEHYAVPFKDVNVKNVTGAGDTFLGVLVNEISASESDIFQNANSSQRKKSIMKAQHGSKLSIECESTISNELKNLI